MIAALISSAVLAVVGVVLLRVSAQAAERTAKTSVARVLDEVQQRILDGEELSLVSTAGGVEVTVNPVLDRPIGPDLMVMRRSVTDAEGNSVLLEGRTSLEGLRSSLRLLRFGLMIAIPLGGLAVGVACAAAVDRALRPVGDIVQQALVVSPSVLNQRLPVPQTSDEIEELAQTVNEMLQRLDTSTIQQRMFVSNASHELRTPLAALIGELELAELRPDLTTTAELATKALALANRLELLVGDLVTLAASEERPTTPCSISFDDLVRSEVALLSGPIDLQLEPLTLVGHWAPLARAVSNLVTNAIRHCDARVNVKLSGDAANAVLTVDDDGEGVAKEDREVIFDRFVRGDLARSRDHGGSGLGLAMVADAASTHGGDVAVVDSPLGGARFVLTVPASPSANAG